MGGALAVACAAREGGVMAREFEVRPGETVEEWQERMWWECGGKPEPKRVMPL